MPTLAYTASQSMGICRPTLNKPIYSQSTRLVLTFLFLIIHGVNPYHQNLFHLERFDHFTAPRVTPRAVLFASRACVLQKAVFLLGPVR